MRLILFLLGSCLCFAQSLSLGVKGGFLATDDVSGAAVSESKRYVVGPMADLSLPFGFGVEVDALYRREGYDASLIDFAGAAGASFSERERANVWEFPILVKYRLGFPLIKPYVEGGYSARHISGSIEDSSSVINAGTGQTTVSQQHSSTISIRAMGLSLAPESGSGLRGCSCRRKFATYVGITHPSISKATVDLFFSPARTRWSS